MRRRRISAYLVKPVLATLAVMACAVFAGGAQEAQPIENPVALRNFFRALADIKLNRRSETVKVMHYGDSHVAADILTGAVRRDFQIEFGNPDSGSAAGVRYDIFGINGMRAVGLLGWSDLAYRRNVESRQPDLIVLAFGTNEVTDNNWSLESYQRMFVRLIRRFRRSAPQASILVFGPEDRALSGSAGWESVKRLPVLIEAQRRAALEAGAAFWNSYAAMGGAGSINDWVARGWAQADHVHLTATGYRILGRLFFNDTIRAFNASNPYEQPSAGVNLDRPNSNRNTTRSIRF